MSIGQRRQEIVIQSRTDTTDAEGQGIASWVTFITVWARAEYLTGRELESLQKINASISLRFSVSYRTDITPLMRVRWRSKNWNIEAVLPAEDTVGMALLCSKTE